MRKLGAASLSLAFALSFLVSCFGSDADLGRAQSAIGSGPDAGSGVELCPSASNIIIGTPGDDYIEGTAGDDCLVGLAGADTLYGFGGNDVIVGGDGDDYSNGGDGDDTLFGGAGNDSLFGGAGTDAIHGETGNDVLYGGSGVDSIHGGDGDDTLVGEAGDTLLGEAGCDALDGRDGTNSLDGGSGNDILSGGYSPLSALGGSGNDFIATCLSAPAGIVNGGFGTDECDGDQCENTPPPGCDPWNSGSCPSGQERVMGICAPVDRCASSCVVTDPLGDSTCDGVDDDCDGSIDEDGACTSDGGLADAGVVDASVSDASVSDATASSDGGLDTSLCPAGSNIIIGTNFSEYMEGTSGDDCIFGLDGDDDIYGLGGNDLIFGGDGDDTISTGGGSDVVYGGPGNDLIDTGDGDDTLYGEAGDDHLNGRGGANTLYGGADNDYLAGEGDDTLFGGPGCDILDARENANFLHGGPGNDVLAGGYAPSLANGGPGDDSIASCLSVPAGIVDGADGDDTCDGDNCENAPEAGCDPWNTGSCDPGMERVVGICVAIDRCDPGSCVVTDPSGDFTCDSADDDCDTLFDEDFSSGTTTCGIGACEQSGVTSCINGVESDSCTPGQASASDAACDGIDSDCDGSTDEDYSGASTSCGIGACTAQGAMSCTAGSESDSCTAGSPAASDASCDGVDDDCNGVADEDFVGQGTSCGVGVCAQAGTSSCVSGSVADTCIPGTATGADADCNGLDDDCDGLIDEGFVGLPTSCGIGECAALGLSTCIAGQIVSTCTPGTPAAADLVCDGLDEDCDGLVDEEYVELATACGIGSCASAGVLACQLGALIDSCIAGDPASVDASCDGLDDDCDGQSDEDYQATSLSCGVGACQAAGASSCALGVEESSCNPGDPAADDSSCDGIDSDCDGSVDEDTSIVTTTCGEGICAEQGSASCVGGEVFDSCRPGLAESIDDTCDGIDDNCDGQIDEDCCEPLTCAEIGPAGASCGQHRDGCGGKVNCSPNGGTGCPSSARVCGTDFQCTSDLTVRAGADRDAVWGQELVFGRDKFDFVAGANGSWEGNSVRVNCEWDFGDGSPVALVPYCSALFRIRPVHSYASPGVYTVTVTGTQILDPRTNPTIGDSVTDTLLVNVTRRPSSIVMSSLAGTANPGEYELRGSLVDAYDGTGVLGTEPVTLSHNTTAVPTVTDANAEFATNFLLNTDQDEEFAASFSGNGLFLPSQSDSTFFVESETVADKVVDPEIGSEGRHFLLAFPQNTTNEDKNAFQHDDRLPQLGLYLHLSARTSTLARISAPGVGFLRQVPVSPGRVTVVKLPDELRTGVEVDNNTSSASGMIQDLAVEIDADEPIAVQALDQISASTDGYLGLPVKELGTEYIVLAYANEKLSSSVQSGGTQLVVAAAEDNTVVTITPSVDISPGVDLPAGIAAGVAHSVTLQRGQTLLLANQGTTDPDVWEDLSGTSVVSSKSVAVFAGHACSTVTTQRCDHLVEQLPPVTSLGRRILTVPLATRQPGDSFQLVATVDNTIVRRDGEVLAQIDRGEVAYFENYKDQYSVIESTEPILLAQYAKGKEYQIFGGSEPADPFMALVQPVERFASSYQIATPPVLKSKVTSQSHYLSLMVREDAARGVRLNGREIGAQWISIGGSGWVGTRIQIPDGSFRIDHRRGGEPIGLMAYGFADYDSYGYVGGWQFASNDCERSRAEPGDTIDNDCDGKADEEVANGLDDDGDGFIDEDTDASSPLANLAPVAEATTFVLTRRVPAPTLSTKFLLPGYDPNDDDISFEIVSGPTGGTASIDGRILHYLAPVVFGTGYSATMQVRAFDGQVYSDPVEIRFEFIDPVHGCLTRYHCSSAAPVVGWGQPLRVRLNAGESERAVSGTTTINFDANRQKVSFEVFNEVGDFVMDGETGSWSYTANRNELGSVNATIRIRQDGLFVQDRIVGFVQVSTDNSNGYPVFISSPQTTMFVEDSYSYTALAIDPESQSVSYSLLQAPAWLSLDSVSGVLSGSPNPLASDLGSHNIEILATDISGSSATQNYNLLVYGSGPTIVSTPIYFGTANSVYNYEAQAVYPGSAFPLQWELSLAPPGMTIDNVTGHVRWTPGDSDLGPHTVRVEVFDTAGVRDGQTFTITVGDESFAPTIVSEAPLRAHVDNLYLYEVEATDPDFGDILGYSLTIAPGGMSIGQGTGLIQWTPDTAGLFAVEVTVYDTALNTDVQQFVIEVDADFVAPQITLSASATSLSLGASTTLSVALQGAFDPATVTLVVDGVDLPLDANLEAVYTPASVGPHLAVATASDGSGNAGSDSLAIAVLDGSDTTAPLAELTSVSEDEAFTYVQDLIGIASDDNLLHYSLALRATSETEFVEFHRGFSSVTADVLGSLDTTLIENGYYELRLVATDVNGLTAEDSRRVRIFGQAKLGHVKLSFVDMAIEMAGIPLTVVRSYDSRDKRSGDFGYGWELDIRAGKVAHNRPVGEGFSVYSGIGGLELPCTRDFEQDSHFTEVRLSPSEWYLFKAKAVNTAAIAGSCAADIVYELFDGSDDGAQLAIIGNNHVRARVQSPTNVPGNLLYGQLTDFFTGENFDPQNLRLRRAGGGFVDLNVDRGIFFVQDAAGNSVAYERTFIAHSDGRSISIHRDASDRVTEIVDPMGNSVQYQYDDQGDLAGVVDLLGGNTQFLYEAPIDHHLTAIINPQGERVAALEYGSDGRLANSCDAEDECTAIAYDLLGLSQTITGPTRRPTSYEYDNLGNVLTSTDGLGNTTTMTYFRDQMLTSADPLGNVTSYTYHGRSQRIFSRTDPHAAGDDPADHTVNFTYSNWPFFNVETETNKAGATIHREYNGLGDTVRIYDDDNNTIQSFARETFGRLSSKTTRFGTKTFEYIGGGDKPSRVVDGNGVETTYAYDDLTRLIRMTRTGVVAEFFYNAAGQTTRRDYGNGVTADYSYTPGVEDWTTLTGPTIGTVTRVFSSTGRLIGWTLPNGDTFGRSFDGAGRVSTETDALGNRTLYEYDGAGNLAQTIRGANGAVTTYSRDATGRTIGTTNAAGFTTSNQWQNGEAAGFTGADGATTSFSNTPISFTSTDALSRTTIQNLTQYGLPLSQGFADGSQASSSFDGTTSIDSSGDFPLSETDESGRVTSRSYQGGNLAQADSGDNSASWSYSYVDTPQVELRFSVESGEVWLSAATGDRNPGHIGASDRPLSDGFDTRDWPRQLSSMTSPGGDTTSFTFGETGHMASILYPDSGLAEYEYGADGKVSLHRQPDGTELTFTRDVSGNELARASTTGESRSFTYGIGDRIETATNDSGTVTRSFDNLGRLSRHQGANGGAVAYTYDILGRISAVTVEVGTSEQVTSYVYDNVGNLISLTDPTGGTTNFTYDAIGRQNTRILPNGIVSSWTYDLRDRVLSAEHRDSNGAILVSRGYIRAPSGEPTRVTREDGSYVTLEYDQSLRITQESYFGNSDILLEQIDYSYDLDGNRIQRTASGVSEDYSHSAGARLDQIFIGGVAQDNFAFDTNGRLSEITRDGETRTLGFNVDDGITQISDGTGALADYQFDAFGGRNGVTVAGVERRFLVAPALGSGFLSNHAVLDSAGQLVGHTVYAGEHPLMRIDSSGAVTYYLQDPQGSTVGLADGSGSLTANIEYDSFGNVRSAIGQAATLPAESLGDYRFQGMWLDSSGLYYVRTRSYDSQTGRFTSRDPWRGTASEPETLLPYAFVNGNPWIARDPLGEFSIAELSVSLYTSGILAALPVVAGGLRLQVAPRIVKAIPTLRTLSQYFRLFGSRGDGERLVQVTRWGREGLRSGDWIVKGRNTWWNYLRSFKWQPGWIPGNNIPSAKALGETFWVPLSSIVRPYSEGFASNFVKWLWGQSQYRP